MVVGYCRGGGGVWVFASWRVGTIEELLFYFRVFRVQLRGNYSMPLQ